MPETESPESLEKGTMPFWDHVYELRNRIVVVIAFLFIITIVAYHFFPKVIEVVQYILAEKLFVTSITEGFLTRLRISLLLGFYFSIPLLFVQLSLFVSPALEKKERIYMVLVLVSSFILLTGGLVFAFNAVLPITLQFLRSDTFFPDNVDRLLSYTVFLQFFFQFLIGFGVFFQFPIVLILLLRFKIIDTRFLIKNFRYFIGIIFLIAAIVTPPDIISQVLLGLPMTVLYGLCIVIGKVFRLDK